MQITNISEVQANLSYLIKKMRETGEPIIIGKAGEPVAILAPYNKDRKPRQLGGSWEGNVKISEDFYKADEEIANNFNNSSLFPDKS